MHLQCVTLSGKDSCALTFRNHAVLSQEWSDDCPKAVADRECKCLRPPPRPSNLRPLQKLCLRHFFLPVHTSRHQPANHSDVVKTHKWQLCCHFCIPVWLLIRKAKMSRHIRQRLWTSSTGPTRWSLWPHRRSILCTAPRSCTVLTRMTCAACSWTACPEMRPVRRRRSD